MKIRSLCSTFKAAKSFFKDPLRQNSAFCLLGDAMFIWSGAEYGNYLRAGSALSGQALHLGGVFLGGERKIGPFRVSDLIMSGVVATGLGYMASGSNILGLEDVPRYFEMAVGACISSGAASVLLEKGTLAKRFFQSATALSFGTALEPALHGSGGDIDWVALTDTDWRMLVGATFFLFSARAAEKIPAAYKNKDQCPENTI